MGSYSVQSVPTDVSNLSASMSALAATVTIPNTNDNAPDMGYFGYEKPTNYAATGHFCLPQGWNASNLTGAAVSYAREWDGNDPGALFAPYTAGDIAFTRANYDTVTGYMDTIFARGGSLNSAMGSDVVVNQRIRATAYFSSNYQTLYWDDSPPWITAFAADAGTNTVRGSWTIANSGVANYALSFITHITFGPSWQNYVGYGCELRALTTTGTTGYPSYLSTGPQQVDKALLIMYRTAAPLSTVQQILLENIDN